MRFKPASFPVLLPNWPAAAQVKAFQTTRHGGISRGPYASLNLSDQVGDDPEAVRQNRQRLGSLLPNEPRWLRQIHSTVVVDAARVSSPPEADASITSQVNIVCVVTTADCLPVLLCNRQGSIVAAVHAGWRGLCDGILEATVHAMKVPAETLLAWFGPAIGPAWFEVDNVVRAAFLSKNEAAQDAFEAVGPPGKWRANLYLLAKQRLTALGVHSLYGGEHCSYSESSDFFSYRRDQTTGRMASVIFLEKPASI